MGADGEGITMEENLKLAPSPDTEGEPEEEETAEEESPHLESASPPVFDDDTFPAPVVSDDDQPASREEPHFEPSGLDVAEEDFGAKFERIQGELRTHWKSSCNSLQRALDSVIQTVSEAYEDGADGLIAQVRESSYWTSLHDKEFWAGKAEEWKGEILDRAEYAWDSCWEETEAWKTRLKEEGINPLYLFSASLLIVVLVFTGLGKFKSRDNKAGLVSDVPALRILLPDGRYVAYREEGVAAEEARHQILVVHGFMSSRLAGIPGIDNSLLEEFGVRVVSYDRPGYGQSDPHPGRNLNTSAQDMVYIADTLQLGQKFWVLGYSGGGPHAWAAIKYIPERLAGVAMFAPMGNPYFGNMTKDERDSIWNVWTFKYRALFFLARRAPSLVPGVLKRATTNKPERVLKNLGETLGSKDRALIAHPKFAASWEQDLKESVRQGGKAQADEIVMHMRDWGFSLSDLFHRSSRKAGFLQRWFGILKTKNEEEVLSLPVHIWQGTDDRLVPAAMNDFSKRMLPEVQLHKLESEGHLSFFCYCEPCHRLILKTLFGEPIGPIGRAAKVEKSDAIT